MCCMCALTRNKTLILLPIFLMVGIFSGYGQGRNTPTDSDTPFEDTRLFYRTQIYGGAFLHTQGWGLNIRKSWRKTGFVNRVLSLEINNMKHPKEQKSFNPYYDDTKGFVFGKLNSLSILRPSYGLQKVVYSKQAKRGVQVSYFTMIGPSIGLVKPVFLEIAHPTVPNYKFLTTEKYDSEEHSFDEIFGRAPATKGLEQTKLYPGIHGKFALNFEYAPSDEMHRALEVGVNFDGFTKEVPIMAFAENSQFFLTFYLNLQFGKKFF